MHQNTSTFTTERLQLAAYLHAGKLLPLLRCEPGSAGKVAFLFDDPAGSGPQLEYEYELPCSQARSTFAEKLTKL
jgi:hypothetical protein